MKLIRTIIWWVFLLALTGGLCVLAFVTGHWLLSVPVVAGGLAWFSPYWDYIVLHPIWSSLCAFLIVLASIWLLNFVEEGAVPVLQGIRDWWSKPAPYKGWSSVRDDKPIELLEQDQLGRGDFVKKLASRLLLPPNSGSIVFGIEDVWGLGKTSALNMVEREVKSIYPSTIVIRINLWEIGHSKSLADVFLGELSRGVDIQSHLGGRSVVKRIADLRRWKRLISSIGGDTAPRAILQFIGDIFRVGGSQPGTDELKALIDFSLGKLNQPVVIIIDDIDRCSPEDIRTAIQLVKALCNYMRIAYVIAFDEAPVIKALGYGNHAEGRSFLDKVIQVTYHLPRFAYVDKKAYLTRCLDSYIAAEKIKVTEIEKENLGEALIIATRAILSPRDAKRVVNLAVSWAVETRGEVDIGDIVLLAVLAVRYPPIWTRIRQSPANYAIGDRVNFEEYSYTRQLQDAVPSVQGDANAKSMFWKSNVDEYAGAERDNLADVLAFLFPPRFTQYNHKPAPPDQQRVVYLNTLKVLLSRGVSHDTFSATDATHFINDPRLRNEIYQNILRDRQIKQWFPFLAGYLKRTPTKDRAQFWDFIAGMVREAFVQQKAHVAEEAAGFLLVDLKLVSDEAERFNLVSHLMKNKESLSLSEALLRLLLKARGMWNEGQYLPDKALVTDAQLADLLPTDLVKELVTEWTKTVGQLATPTRLLHEEPEPSAILFRWGELDSAGFEHVHQFTSQILKHPEELADFANLYSDEFAVDGLEGLFSSWKVFREAVSASERIRPQTREKLLRYNPPRKIRRPTRVG